MSPFAVWFALTGVVTAVFLLWLLLSGSSSTPEPFEGIDNDELDEMFNCGDEGYDGDAETIAAVENAYHRWFADPDFDHAKEMRRIFDTYAYWHSEAAARVRREAMSDA